MKDVDFLPTPSFLAYSMRVIFAASALYALNAVYFTFFRDVESEVRKMASGERIIMDILSALHL